MNKTRQKMQGTWLATLAAPIILAVLMSSVQAQVVEENRPKLLRGDQLTGLSGGADGKKSAPSEEPFGSNLVSLVLVSKPGEVVPSPRSTPGIHVDDDLSVLHHPAFIKLMDKFLNQPLSQKLVADIRVAIVKFFRSQKRPLVTVSVLPQEVTKGVLQLVVTPFRIGSIETQGNRWTSDDYVRRNIRLSTGDEIASDKLVEDANWLNLNPYRNLVVVFEPGRKPGETNLTLRSREVKPWTVYGGYANSGTPATDKNRIIAGFNIANLPMIDHQFAYQLTTSPNVWQGGGKLSGNSKLDYLSHAATYFVPLSWRHKLNFQGSYVESNSVLNSPFTQANKTIQAYGEYAIPLATSGAFRLEIYGAADFKHQKTDLFFSGALARATTLNIAQGVLGARGRIAHELGVASFDVRGVISPGDIVDHNNDAAFVAASTNPDAHSNYNYFYGKLNQVTPIAKTGFLVQSNVTVQLSDKALLGIEQLAMGGASTVRGYSELEVSGDQGVIFSNELRAPAFQVLGKSKKGIEDRAVLFGFVDYGFAKDRFSGTTSRPASIGAGLDYSLNNYLQASVSYGHALKNTVRTNSGDHRGHFNFTLRY